MRPRRGWAGGFEDSTRLRSSVTAVLTRCAFCGSSGITSPSNSMPSGFTCAAMARYDSGRHASQLRQVEKLRAELLQVVNDAVDLRSAGAQILLTEVLHFADLAVYSLSSRMRRRHSASAAEARPAIMPKARRMPNQLPRSKSEATSWQALEGRLAIWVSWCSKRRRRSAPVSDTWKGLSSEYRAHYAPLRYIVYRWTRKAVVRTALRCA